MARLVDGNTSTADSLNYAVHPLEASGTNITFTLDGKYVAGSFVFFNRTSDRARISGSTVEFFNGDTVVHTYTFPANFSRTGITITPAVAMVFDKVVLTFVQVKQNFREIEIWGIPQ